MLDYQRIVDNLRSSLYQANADGIDLLRSAVADYAAACDEVNERLRRCGSLLSRGLRSEAIQLCEIEPNLLEVVASLDVPERDQWSSFLGHYGIMPPSSLLMDVAAELNEAYALEQPLAALLRRHRLMALGRSPLLLRLRTLRDLATLDPNNLVWRDDLLTFERERYKQIQQEAIDAKAHDDLPKLTSLCEELGREPWSEIPPPSLRRLLGEAHEAVRRRFSRRRLRDLELELNAAFSIFDVEAGRLARQEWESLLPTAHLASDDVLIQKAAPALEWLAEEDRRQQEQQKQREAIAALERALDKGQSQAKLERLYHAAIHDGYEFPAPLLARYQNRLESLQLASSRRSRLIITAIVSATILVAGLVGWIISNQLHASRVTAAVEALQQQLKDKDFVAAQEYLGHLEGASPSVASAPQIAEIRAAIRSEVKRSIEAEEVFAAAVGLTVRCLEVLTTLDPLAGDQKADEELTGAIASLETLARTAQHKTKILELQTKASQLRAERQRHRDMVFRNDLAQLTEKVNELEKRPTTNGEERLNAIQTLKGEVTAVENRARISFALKEQIKPLRARLGSVEDNIQGQMIEDRHCRDLTAVVGDAKRADRSRVDAYRKELERFRRDFPDSLRSQDFERALEEESLWVAALEWQSLAEDWRSVDLRTLTSEAAGAILKRLSMALKEHGELPGSSVAGQIVPHLEAIHRQADGSLVAGLRKLLSDPLVAEVGMREYADGTRYYFSPPEKPSFEYIIAFNMKARTAVVKNKQVRYAGRSPQAILSEKLNRTLSTLREDTWESSFLTMIDTIRAPVVDQAAGGVDPVLKLRLLRETLKTACAGSHCLATGYGEHLSLLERSEISPFTNWVDPEDADGRSSRVRAIGELRLLPDFDAARKAASAEWQSLRQVQLPDWRWVGWLKRGSEGQWTCAAPAENLGGITGKLIVVRRGSEKNMAEIVDVGQLEGGLAVIRADELGAMVEGRPLFLITEATVAGLR